MRSVLFPFTVLFLFLCVDLHSVFAQYDHYLLKDYMNPDYKRQSLDFSFNGNFSNSSNKRDGSHPEYTYKDALDQIKMTGGLSLGYNRIKNTIRTQNNTSVDFLFNGNYGKDKSFTDTQGANSYNYNQDRLSKTGMVRVGLDFRNTGYYYGNNKNFLLLGPTAGFSYSHGNYKLDDKTNTSYKNTTRDLSAHAAFSLGIGKGRIEEVGDARQAVYLLQDLQKYGILEKELSQEEIDELARLVTKVKNKRQFDSRIRLIQEITSVDSLLIEKGYIGKEHSAAYFTTLYDNWQYANVNRRSGNRFTVSLRPFVVYSHYKIEKTWLYDNNPAEHDTTKYFDYGGNFVVSFDSEKPVNLYWQRALSIEFTTEWRESDYPKHSERYHSLLSADYGWVYYPNSRTSIGGFFSELLAYTYKERQFQTSTSLLFDLKYYFSPQLRLNISYRFGYTYIRSDDKDTDWLVTSRNKYPDNFLSINLMYSIF
ncbi:MAG: hypothetical protein LBQ60_15960 [Bacteroidales bacterium]|jgi:hypothetical protein|nr:hypothetical protein [Bacteroidales bacterium]